MHLFGDYVSLINGRPSQTVYYYNNPEPDWIKKQYQKMASNDTGRTFSLHCTHIHTFYHYSYYQTLMGSCDSLTMTRVVQVQVSIYPFQDFQYNLHRFRLYKD